MPLADVSQPGQGYWSSYTPTWTSTGTQPALGNGTLTGFFAIIGETLFVKVNWLAGSTTTFGTGAWAFSLPLTTVAYVSHGHGEIEDASPANQYMVFMRWASTTTFSICTPASPTVFVTNTTPITFAQNDVIRIEGWMELA